MAKTKLSQKPLGTLKVFAIFFGTIIGAGFASGREVYVYFARFGGWGLIMTLLAGFTFFCLGYMFLQLGKRCQANTMSEFFKLLFGRFAPLCEILVVFSYIIVLGAMFAGFDSLQKILMEGDVLYPFIAILSAVLCVFAVLGGLKNISRLNSILLPMVILFLAVIFVVGILKKEHTFASFGFESSFVSMLTPFLFCIVFVCSNMFLTGFILLKTGSETSKNVDKYAAFLTGLVLFILSFFSCLAIALNPTAINYDMPFMFLAFKVSDGFVILSLVILWFAIFTTAVATLYTLAWWLNGFIKDFFVCTCVVCVFSFVLSRIGFTAIINVFYPLTGVMDIVFVLCAIILFVRAKKIKKTTQKPPDDRVVE